MGASSTAASWLLGRRLRQRWAAMAPLALVVALGATGAFVGLGAAERTTTAYERYLDRAEVGDLQVNPGLSTAEIDRVVRGLPGVRAATRDAVFLAGIGEGRPRTSQEVRALATVDQVLGSTDGRTRTMDRPALDAGRLPTGRREALVSVELARARRIEVGDVVPVSFWDTRGNVLAPPDAELPPMRVEHLRVVGIATLADEVLPDDLYPRRRLVVSPDVAARYDCLPEAPPRRASAAAAAARLAPEGCAVEFPFYSLSVAGGQRGVAAALDALERREAELNARLPQSLTWLTYEPPSYGIIATTTAQERARVDRSTAPTSSGLVVLGLAAAGVTVVVFGLGAAREVQRSEHDQRQWWELGLTTAERVPAVVAPVLLAVAAGLAAALAAAWLLSPIGPVGIVRSVEPSPGHELSPWALAAALGVGAACTAVAALLTARSAQRVSRGATPASASTSSSEPRSVGAVQRLLPGWSRPEVAEGVRAAYRGGRGAGLLMATGMIALAVVLSVMVFGASLTAVVTRPPAYGWPWDVAMMGGAGHGGVDLDAARPALDARSDVAGWTALGLTNGVVDGEPVPTVVTYDDVSTVDVTLVSGRLPAGPHQLALAARTAQDLDVGVGDEVDLAGEAVRAGRATVTAIVVLPALGAYISDRAGPGTGALIPSAAIDAGLAPRLVTFLGIDLAAGADPNAVARDLRDDFAAWDHLGFRTFDYTTPVRPAEIVNADAMRAVPLLVGVLLGLTGATALTAAVVVSVRARRRDLAVLRALGFTGRQVRNAVRVQAVAAMAAALAVGAPAGIVTGRLAWRSFAAQLGVGANPTIPSAWLLATVGAAFAAALTTAALPARIATRATPAATLRTE